MQQFSFEKLTVYQRSLNLATTIYSLTSSWPREHLYSITDQIRRASSSIALNIAEGYSRTRKDFKHFLTIARGSCYECIPLLSLAQNLKLLSAKDHELLYNELVEISRMISSLRSKLM